MRDEDPEPLADPWWFTDAGVPVHVDPDTLPTFTLREVARYGTLEGVGALDAVNSVAVSSAVLVASDWRDCTFVVFDRKTRAALRRFGRCGEGPEEFRNTVSTSIALAGDSLLIVDDQGRRARWFTLDGRLRGTVPMDSLARPVRTQITTLAPFSDSLALLAVGLPTTFVRDARLVAPEFGQPYLRLVDPTNGRVHASVLREGPAVRDSAAGVLRAVSACVITHPDGRASVIAANRRAPQVVRVDLAIQPPRMAGFLLERIGSIRSRDPNRPASAADPVHVACAGGRALLRHVPLPPSNAEADRANWFLYDAARDRWAIHRAVTADGGILSAPLAGDGEAFFLVEHSFGDYPVIREVRVDARPRQPEGEGDREP